MLGSCTLHWLSYQVHQRLLLGQEYLLSTMGRTGTQRMGRKQTSNDTLLSMDTVRAAGTGLILYTYTNLSCLIEEMMLLLNCYQYEMCITVFDETT